MSHAEIAQRSTRGSLALFAGTFLNATISALALVIITRQLGPNDFGVYTLVSLVPNILLNFLGFGVGSGITRYAAYHLSRNEPEIARRMTVNGLIFLVTFGVLLSGICYGGATLFSSLILHRPDLAGLVRFSSLLVLAQTLFTSGIAALLGWSYMGQMSLSYTLQGTGRLVLSVGLVALGFGVAGAVAGYAGSLTIASALSLLVLWRRMRSTPGVLTGADRSGSLSSDVKTMLGFGRSLFVGQLAVNFSSQFIVALLALISSNTIVGFYQSAGNVTVAISLSSSAMSQALFPAFAHLDGTEGDTRLAFRYAVKYMGYLLTPLVLLIMVASSSIIGVLYPSSYSPDAPYLFLLSLSNIGLLLGFSALSSFFNGVGRPRLYMVYCLADAGAQFVLAPVLGIVAGLGVSGLLYSIVISSLVGTVVGLWLALRYLGARIDLWSSASVLAASLASYGIVVLSERAVPDLGDGPTLVLDILVFSLVYLTVAPLLGAIDGDDVRRLEVATDGLGKLRAIFRLVLKYEALVLGATRGAGGSNGTGPGSTS